MSWAEAADSGELLKLGLRRRVALRSFFLRRARPDEADDLVQEVFLRLHKRSPGPAVKSLDSYLFETASNVLVDQARRDTTRRRSEHCELSNIHHPVDERSPERVLRGRQEIAAALEALNELPARTREVFALVRFEGHSYKLIADRLGVSVSAVEKHMIKAMRHVGERLREQDDLEQPSQRRRNGPR